MPIKRNAPSKAAPAKTRSASPVKRVLKRVAKSGSVPLEETPVSSTPRFLSSEEKRQLILAHAAMRRPHDPIQMLSVWAGVVATVAVLVVGYWYATKPSFVEASNQPFDSELAPALENIKVFSDKVREIPAALQQAQEPSRLDTLEKEAKARQSTLDALAGQINDEKQPVRVDLIKPMKP